VYSPRLIPVLLVSKGRLVKTIRFDSPRYVGDPINVSRIFNEKEADELILLDITASTERRNPDFQLIEELASECFMPVCYGGGIRNEEQARTIFRLGIEKVCLQTGVLRDSSLVTRLSDQFGSQAIVVSMDLIKDKRGGLHLYSAAEKRVIPGNWLEHLERLVNLGAGEVILTSVYREGTKAGLDLYSIAEASKRLGVPLIAHGGVGSVEHVRAGLSAGANAVGSGSFLVFHGKHDAVLITYPLISDFE